MTAKLMIPYRASRACDLSTASIRAHPHITSPTHWTLFSYYFTLFSPSIVAQMVLFDHRIRSNRFLRVLVPDNLLAVLCRAWILLVIWGEIGVFVYALLVCRWPKLTQNMVRSTLCPSSVVRLRPLHLTQAESRTRPTRILLVADAQVPMPLAHSQTSTELFNDIYTRRAWKVTRHMRPDLVIFLGDMLRTGRSVESDDE